MQIFLCGNNQLINLTNSINDKLLIHAFDFIFFNI